jgi:hypothetical protein
MNPSSLASWFYAAIAVSIVITPIYIFLVSRFISVLRDSHHDAYVSMGEPTLVTNNTPANSARLVWFILSGKYKRLADGGLITLGRVCQILFFIGFCSYVFCWIVLTYYWQALHS